MLIRLLKIEIMQMVSGLVHIKSKNKKSVFAGLFSFTWLVGSITFFQMASFILAFKELGLLNLFPLSVYFFYFYLSFYIATLNGTAYLFKCRDYELLSALPIPKKKIVFAKLICLYLFNLYLAIIMLAPSYLILIEHNVIKNVYYLLISIIFSPILPLSFSIFIGIIIEYATKFVSNKEIFSTILSFFTLIFISFLTLYSFTSETLSKFTDIIYNLLPWSIYITEMQAGNFNSLVSFATFSIVVGAVFFNLLSLNYEKLYFILGETSRKTKKVKDTKIDTNDTDNSDSNSHIVAMIKKEFKTLFNCSDYAMNALFPSASGLISIGVLFYFKDDIRLYSSYISPFLVYAPLMITGVFGSIPTTSCSTSLEGKFFWIVQSSPISVTDIMLSKCIFNALVNLPICILLSITTCHILELDLVWCIITILLPLLYCMLIGFLGLFANLKFPNYTWKSTIVPVKQSLPVYIILFINAVVMGTLYFIVTTLGDTTQIVARIYFAIIFVLILANVASYEILLRKETL